MKTIAQILTEDLKGKWVEGSLGDTPPFSGTIVSILALNDSAGDGYFEFTVNTGQKNESYAIYNIAGLKLTVC